MPSTNEASVVSFIKEARDKGVFRNEIVNRFEYISVKELVRIVDSLIDMEIIREVVSEYGYVSMVYIRYDEG